MFLNRNLRGTRYFVVSENIVTNNFAAIMKAAKLFLLCHPHNPVGRAWQEDELWQLAALAEQALAQKPVPDLWLQLQDSLHQSKQNHLRNSQLLQRQLAAVKGSLQALQGESAPNVDLYDRMGQMAKRHGAWGYQLA